MRDTPRMQPYLSPTYDLQGKLDGFSLSINHGDISFEMIELTVDEVKLFLEDIKDQMDLIIEACQDEGSLDIIDFGKAGSDHVEVS